LRVSPQSGHRTVRRLDDGWVATAVIESSTAGAWKQMMS
jgi:hypothetical protein